MDVKIQIEIQDVIQDVIENQDQPMNTDDDDIIDLTDGLVQTKIKEFLLDREFDLQDFSPKKLTEEQQSKITEITNFLTGKASSSFSGAKAESKPASEDFEFEDNFAKTAATTTSASEDEDDFFNDL